MLRVCVSALLLTLTAYSQDARGRILGRVSDATGAAVAEAAVRVTNVATQVTLTAKSNAAGSYSVPYLIPGTYRVEAELTGFKKYIRENIQVRIDDSVEVNIEMQVGDVAERIEVSAETPLLSTAESSLGQVIDERRVLELPLFAGNAMNLVHLTPGVTNGTDLRLRKQSGIQQRAVSVLD